MAEALAAAEKTYQLAPWNDRVVGILAAALARTGNKTRSEALVQPLRKAPPYRSWAGMMFYHLLCGELDAGADWFEKAIEVRSPFALYYLRHPMLKPLRSTPHWPDLLRKMNLPVSS